MTPNPQRAAHQIIETYELHPEIEEENQVGLTLSCDSPTYIISLLTDYLNLGSKSFFQTAFQCNCCFY